jgi:hypothetical protein
LLSAVSKVVPPSSLISNRAAAPPAKLTGGGDVFLQVGDGLAVADQHGLPQPGVAAGFDADAGGDEFGGGLPLHLAEFDLELLAGVAEDVF